MLNQSRPVHDSPTYVKSVTLTAYEPGDLIYVVSGIAYPASSQADQSSEAANQVLFATNFFGICQSQKLVTDASTDEISVLRLVEYQFTCDSDTYVVGDYIAANESAGGTALEDQVVKKSSTAAHAIAYCTKQVPVADTKVWGLLIDPLARPNVALT